jgi:hypothetical protein
VNPTVWGAAAVAVVDGKKAKVLWGKTDSFLQELPGLLGRIVHIGRFAKRVLHPK